MAAQTPKTQELAEEHLNQALLARLVEVVRTHRYAFGSFRGEALSVL
ncbi:hypothetical protein P4S68_19140 [Pseudoalteromonas sp. Hal099]